MENINELEFYSKFARPLIFALPDAKDRVLAAAWVKKIKEDEQAHEKLKTDYIKLLLFALQRKKLVGIFTDDPTNYEVLEEFPGEYDLNAMAEDLIIAEQKERRTNIRRQLQGQIGDFPPYTTDISSDLREYVAAQDIPGFGVHCYYAISKDPITQWQKADKGIFPKMAKSAVDTSSPLPMGHGKSAGTCVSCPGPEGEPCKPLEPTPYKKKKRKIKKLGDTPPIKPLATKVPPQEERKPPTWSSTLMEVLDAPRPTAATGAIPKVRSEKGAPQRYEPLAFMDSDLEEEYNEIERAIRDYERGEIIEEKKRRRKTCTFDDDEEDDQEEIGRKAKVEYDLENFFDLNETEYEQELKEDSLLVKYFRDTIQTRTMQKEIDRVAENAQGVLPAQAGIPLTTPKPSVSPKRLKSPNLYTTESPLQKEASKETDPSKLKCSFECSGRDGEMDKLFQEAMALSDLIEDEMAPDYSDVKTDTSTKEDISRDQQLPEPEVPQPRPMHPITRGSPNAHKVFKDVVPSLMETLRPRKISEKPHVEKAIDQDVDVSGFPADTSLGKTCYDRTQPVRQVPESTYSTPQYGIPPKSRLEKEKEYIDYLFRHDRKTAEMLKRVANVVQDIEQDEPDPDIFPPSPPFPDVGPVQAIADETFSDLIPTSPIASPTQLPQHELSQIQKTVMPASRIPQAGGSRIPTQSRLKPPSTRTQIPTRPGAASQPSGKPCPSTAGARRMQEEFSQRTGASQPSGKPCPSTSGASRMQEEFSQRTGIAQPQFSAIEQQSIPSPQRLPATSPQRPPPQPQFSPREQQQSVPFPQRLPVTPPQRSPDASKQFSPREIQQTPQRLPPQQRRPSPQPTPPRPFPDDERMFDFAKGYIPPTYHTPPGIEQEAPPQFYSPERTPPQPSRRYSPEQDTSYKELPSQLHQTPVRTRREAERLYTTVRRRLDESNVDEFLADVMARHPDLPPSDFSPPARKSPPRSAGISGWQPPERALPKTPHAKMLDATQPPQFYSPPEMQSQFLASTSPPADFSRRSPSTGMSPEGTYRDSRGTPTRTRTQGSSPGPRICPSSQRGQDSRNF
uniref:Protein piccolo-like n=1 Tax=Diabrotica virgifera virgifera TaxID=50390 RepID=A0A6P7GUY2_DIAVI